MVERQKGFPAYGRYNSHPGFPSSNHSMARSDRCHYCGKVDV